MGDMLGIMIHSVMKAERLREMTRRIKAANDDNQLTALDRIGSTLVHQIPFDCANIVNRLGRQLRFLQYYISIILCSHKFQLKNYKLK